MDLGGGISTLGGIGRAGDHSSRDGRGEGNFGGGISAPRAGGRGRPTFTTPTIGNYICVKQVFEIHNCYSWKKDLPIVMIQR